MSDPAPSKELEGEAVLEDPLVGELLAARLVCVLATFDVRAAIHAVPMWYAADEGCVLLATGARSRKVRNLERDSRATFVVHDSRPGFEVCGVSIAGRVELVRSEAALPLVRRVHRRYVEERDDEPAEVREFLSSDDVAICFRPESALTWDQRGSSANEALRVAGGALALVPTDPRAS
jgi:nitroimidazol reductase NimA-like FMN-containing flavoprotein (pyridoxamine 5'-phosphate oxidase superfamily)